MRKLLFWTAILAILVHCSGCIDLFFEYNYKKNHLLYSQPKTAVYTGSINGLNLTLKDICHQGKKTTRHGKGTLIIEAKAYNKIDTVDVELTAMGASDKNIVEFTISPDTTDLSFWINNCYSSRSNKNQPLYPLTIKITSFEVRLTNAYGYQECNFFDYYCLDTLVEQKNWEIKLLQVSP